MFKIYCQKGFAMLELSLSLLTSLSIAAFFIGLLYTAAARLWLDQVTYDAVICLAEGRAESRCENELKIKAHWIGAKAARPDFDSFSRSWRVKVLWKLPRNIELSTHRSLEQGAFY